ncbi:MAG: viroplasmin family protein [Steroidobacter sp.]
MASKFYVVWSGRKTGVFTDWATTRQHVDKFAGARFKSFPTRAEAEHAFRSGKPAFARARVVAKTSTIRAPSDADAAAFDLQIYCDGACDPNPGNAGSGIAVYRDGRATQLWYGLYHPNGTNNTAELNALHQALLMAEHAVLAGESPQVLSDSKYAINCIAVWAAGWEKKGWRKPGGEIKNLEIIQAIYALYNRIKAQIQLTHISAHVGTEGNELADRMAMFAVQSRAADLQRYPAEFDVQTILRMRAG